ncbi:MAG: amidohydrolase family protein [Proteobacteria bacterium]|nr:amidohydrolase family protein [Pseudomonadota bacterium]
MKAIRARTVVMTPEKVLDDGFLVVEQGRIAAVGPWRELSRSWSGPVEDLGEVAICAGVFNMHTHLELSHLRGQTVQGHGFSQWVKSLIALPMAEADDATLDAAVAELAAGGTAWVVDITSRKSQQVAAALERAGLGYTLGIEFFGHQPTQGLVWPQGASGLSESQWQHVSAAGHALYSTSPETLRAAKAWCTEQGRVFPLHLAEHQGEEQLLASGDGEFAELLRLRVLPQDFTPPGCSPVESADRLGLLDGRTLAVHCVRLSEADIRRLAERGTSVCLCPRSNEYIGVGRAPWAALKAAGLNLCLGTDSLSSNQDLNVWNEAIHIIEKTGGEIGFAEVLRWLTVNPARFLGLENTHGTLESGKVAGYSIVPDGIERS